MKKTLIILSIMMVLLMLVGCSDPKPSGGESNPSLPELNQGTEPGVPGSAPSASEGASQSADPETGSSTASPLETGGEPAEETGPDDIIVENDPVVEVSGTAELIDD